MYRRKFNILMLLLIVLLLIIYFSDDIIGDMSLVKTPTFYHLVHIVSAVICLLVSVIIGSWRNYCVFWAKYLQTNCPFGWRNSIVRFGTLFIVFFASVWFSFIGASLIVRQEYSLNWLFLFLTLFLSRWLISRGLGYYKAKKEYYAFLRQVEKEGGRF